MTLFLEEDRPMVTSNMYRIFHEIGTTIFEIYTCGQTETQTNKRKINRTDIQTC